MLPAASLVRSLAGKDKGQLLGVVREDEEGVWLADGKHRPLERPKRKNPRHVKPLGRQLDGTAMTTNRALRRALRDADRTQDDV